MDQLDNRQSIHQSINTPQLPTTKHCGVRAAFTTQSPSSTYGAAQTTTQSQRPVQPSVSLSFVSLLRVPLFVLCVRCSPSPRCLPFISLLPLPVRACGCILRLIHLSGLARSLAQQQAARPMPPPRPRLVRPVCCLPRPRPGCPTCRASSTRTSHSRRWHRPCCHTTPHTAPSWTRSTPPSARRPLRCPASCTASTWWWAFHSTRRSQTSSACSSRSRRSSAAADSPHCCLSLENSRAAIWQPHSTHTTAKPHTRQRNDGSVRLVC